MKIIFIQKIRYFVFLFQISVSKKNSKICQLIVTKTLQPVSFEALVNLNGTERMACVCRRERGREIAFLQAFPVLSERA